GFRFLDAVERDNDEPLGGVAMKRNDVFGAGNEVRAGRSGRGSGLWANLLKRFRVGYLADVNDMVGSRLSLSAKSSNRHRAHSKAREHGQRHCVLSLHDFLPDDYVLRRTLSSLRTCRMPTPAAPAYKSEDRLRDRTCACRWHQGC